MARICPAFANQTPSRQPHPLPPVNPAPFPSSRYSLSFRAQRGIQSLHHATKPRNASPPQPSPPPPTRIAAPPPSPPRLTRIPRVGGGPPAPPQEPQHPRPRHPRPIVFLSIHIHWAYDCARETEMGVTGSTVACVSRPVGSLRRYLSIRGTAKHAEPACRDGNGHTNANDHTCDNIIYCIRTYTDGGSCAALRRNCQCRV